MTGHESSRREILTGLGIGLGGLLAGTGSAGADQRGRHIVGTSTAAATQAAQNRADTVHRTLDFGSIGQAVAGEFPAEALAALQNNPNVRYVEADATVAAISQALPWGVDRVDADVVHDDGETGGDDTDSEGGADVAIIDTGIDSDHPDLQANLGVGRAYVDCSGNCAEPWDDDNDHGTHCAGIAAAADNAEGVVGVAPGATLHAVKVLDGDGGGYVSDVAAGIEYTADRGWEVGSLSLGASSGTRTLRDACQYAADNGVLLVAAAGNSGPCTDCVSYPAAYATVMAVSSTDSDDTLSGFSATGSEIALAAPGGSVYSTVVGGYATFSGTSMACPHVSGAGAQLMDNGDTASEARDRLHSTAEDIGLTENEAGSGLLNVAAALASSGGDAAPSVSWVTPSDGETVAGTLTVQIAASDSEDSDDSLAVTYAVDDGSARATSYDSASGYYEDALDTTQYADGDHTLTATVTDSAGNTDTSTVTGTTDNTEATPAVDSLSAAEVETSDGDAAFDADWAVSDADGDLSSVDLAMVQDSDGTTEESVTESVSGSDAAGTTRLVAAGDDGSGNGYTVEVTVTDSGGRTDSGSTSVSETEDTNAAPTTAIDGLTDNSNPAWTRYDVDWSASDGDGNLDTVVVEMRDGSGRVVDSVTTAVTGDSAAGVDGVRTKRSAADIVVTVTDTDGATDSDSRSI